jgi:hypothetical protein
LHGDDPVRKKSATVCLLLAWLCANGAVSDLAQIFAWGRMFSGYARVLSVNEALAETFDASKPCDLCVAVQETRENDSQPQAVAASSQKLFLACASTMVAQLLPPPVGKWPAASDWIVATRIEPVPVRPPRA